MVVCERCNLYCFCRGGVRCVAREFVFLCCDVCAAFVKILRCQLQSSGLRASILAELVDADVIGEICSESLVSVV